MKFDAPEWFLLIPALLVAGFFWKNLRIFSPLRFLLVCCLALLLAHPILRKQDDALDLHVLLDRSESTEDLIDQGLPEWKKLLENAKPGRNDRLYFHNYAQEIAELGKDGAVFTGSRKLTRTNLALQTIASSAGEKKPARILVFTDGYSTEPLHESASQLQSRGIPLDFRLIREEGEEDYRVARIHFPERVQAAEPFLLGVTVRGTNDGEIPIAISRNKQVLLETTVKIINGVGMEEFTDRIPRTGSYEYSVEIRPKIDAHPGNNKLSRWIEITGGPRVLIATRYADDPLVAVLKSHDINVEVISDLTKLQPGKLSGARAVILNNVPAHEVPRNFLDALDFYVRDQGGSLMMVGGKQSFGAGGYFQSSIDALLPVSMELKSEHRKLAVALAIVMDRSGSMAVSVGGGQTKMDLANQGAANAIDLLGEMDQVAVYAVDSAPEEVVPMSKVAGAKAKLGARVKKIQSSGGGIFVYEGLKAGWDALRKTNVGTRHLILFSDASDSEEPGDFKNLLKEMTSKGATVSVIGLGTNGDIHASLLEEIAKLGKGRIFFSDRPVDIPKIFAQETVTIARSAFLTDPVATKVTGRWTEISPQSLNWLPSIDGYNLSYAREDATVALVSSDEYLAPLIATARRGLGRTAAISFPLGGEYSQKIRAWDAYGDFSQTLVRWLMGLELPPGIGMKTRTEGTRMSVDLLYDTELWSEKFSAQMPSIRLLEDNSNRPAYEAPWKRMEPGRFSLSRDFNEGSSVRGALQVGGHAIPFGPVTIGSSVEWAFEPERIAELRAVSAQTGGRELLDLSQAWLRPPFIHETNLRIPLCLLVLFLLLADALATRTGWKMPIFEKVTRAPKVAKQKPVKQKEIAPEIIEKPIIRDKEEQLPKAPEVEQSERRNRYQRAKDRK